MYPSVEVRAFPTSMTSEVNSVVLSLSAHQEYFTSEPFCVCVQGEVLAIPYRVYYQEGLVLKCAELPDIQGLAALCLGTRHGDGFLREKCLKRIIAVEESWVVPYVIQLLGEYVLEIVQLIEHSLPTLNARLYGEFLVTNAAYYRTLRQRVISYWNVYYRWQFPEWQEYSGCRVLLALDSFAKSSTW
jgi:hypothetical protein